MADDDTKTDPPAETDKDDAESKFWDKLSDQMGKLIDAKFAARDEARKKAGNTNPPADLGTNRTGAQPVSLKSWIADIVYGPKK